MASTDAMVTRVIKVPKSNAHTRATCAPKSVENKTIINDEILICMVSDIGKVK